MSLATPVSANKVCPCYHQYTGTGVVSGAGDCGRGVDNDSLVGPQRARSAG